MYGRIATAGPVGGNRFLSLWRCLCAAFLLWSGSHVPALAAEDYSGLSREVGGINSTNDYVMKKVRFMTTNGTSRTVHFRITSGSVVGPVRQTTAGGTGAPAGGTDFETTVGTGGWSNLNPVDGATAQGVIIPTAGYLVEWAFSNSFANILGSARVSCKGGEYTVTYKANATPAGKGINLDRHVITIDPVSGIRHECVQFHIRNTTGVPQTLQFANDVVTLEPGTNNFTRCGPVDDNGMPVDWPPDLEGVIGADGSFTGILGFHPSGEGTAWRPDPPEYGSDDWNGEFSPPDPDPDPDPDPNPDPDPDPNPDPDPDPEPGNGGTTNNITNNYDNRTTNHNSTTNNYDNRTTNNNTTNETNNNYNLDVSGPGVGPVGDLEIDVPEGLENLADIPQGGETLGPRFKEAGEEWLSKLQGWQPFSDLAPGGGDLTSIDVPLPGGFVAHVNLPVDLPSINVFRLCCLFCLYWRYTLYIMRTLKI
jgi:hypothetical protein